MLSCSTSPDKLNHQHRSRPNTCFPGCYIDSRLVLCCSCKSWTLKQSEGGGETCVATVRSWTLVCAPSVRDMYSSAYPRAALPCVVTWHVWPCVMSRYGRVHMASDSRFAWGAAAKPSSFSTIFLLFSVSNYSLSPRSLSSWSYLLFHSLAKQLPLPDSAPLDSMAG